MNGKKSNLMEFQEHVLLQKKAMHSVRFEYKKVIEEKDFLACYSRFYRKYGCVA
jgi:hypothetical protein